ncbi:MAG: hypothetical protein RL682_1949 [Pseudomonadota bacterium]
MHRNVITAPILLLTLLHNCGVKAQELELKMEPLLSPASLKLAAATPVVQEMKEWLLIVDINGQTFPEPVLVLQDTEGVFWVTGDDLKLWRLRPMLTPPMQHDGLDYYSLGDNKELRYTFNSIKQSLVVEADAAAFTATTQVLPDHFARKPREVDKGGFLNYELVGTQSGSTRQGAGIFEVGVFGNGGVGTMGVVAPEMGSNGRFIRLDTTWTADDLSQRQSWRFGDVVNRAGTWGRAVRMGGIQLSSNFSTQPGFITSPVQQAAGLATLPSTVDVYVNNALAARREVPPGPFSITNLPVMSGNGEVRMVVRDMLGREQVITKPFYASAGLLAKGLTDFSYEAGFVRENIGINSDNYGNWIAAATRRQGFSDSFTGELHFEMQLQQQAVGASGMFLVPQLGIVNTGLATSQSHVGGETDRGEHFSLGFDRQSQAFSYGIHSQWASSGFRQVGNTATQYPIARQLSASVGYTIGNWGALGLSFLKLDAYDQSSLDVTTVSYSRSLGRLGALSVSLVRSRSDETSTQLGLFLNVPLERHHNFTLSQMNTQGGMHETVATLQKSVAVDGSVGYQVTASDSGRAHGVLDYQNSTGAYEVEAARTGEETALRGSVRGGVAVLGGHAYRSSWISDSFGVAHVADFPGVRVYTDNQLAGVTNASGNVVLPRLRAYENNKIRIDSRDLPLNAQVDALSVEATPYFRTGVLAEFPIRKASGALFQIMLDNGQTLPAGSTVEVNAGETRFPVANDGEVYVTGLVKQNKFVARWKNQSCAFDISLEPSNDPLPDLGRVVCHGVLP